MKSLIYFLGIAAIVANSLDLLTTLTALTLKAGVELNGLYYTLGPLGFFLVKIFLPMTTIGAGLILATKYKFSGVSTGFGVLFIALTIIFAFATINNIGVILNVI
jgi:hypothetical protein